MIGVAEAINSFLPAEQQANFASPDDPILEIPLSEYVHVLDDMLSVYNQMAEVVRDTGIIRGKELARLAEDHARAIRAGNHTTLKEALV
jgi:hypothetical protein